MDILDLIIILLVIVLLIIIFYYYYNKMNGGSNNNVPVVNVDLNKYQGKWYEVARLPFIFQNNCKNSTAVYKLDKATNTIGIINSCDTSNGKSRVTGVAVPKDKEITAGSGIYPGRLTVKFDGMPFAKGDYNIIDIDKSYTYALVGTNNRKYLWVLSKTNNIPTQIYNNYIRIADKLGYDTSKIIIDVQPQ
jgi:apolipoprotein D and lipocalin family protein